MTVQLDSFDAGSGSSLDYKYIWDSTQAEAYQAALELEDVKVAFRNLQTGISSAETAEDINSNVCSFQRVMDSVCAPLFKRNVKQFSDEYTLMSQSNLSLMMNVEKKEMCFIDV